MIVKEGYVMTSSTIKANRKGLNMPYPTFTSIHQKKKNSKTLHYNKIPNKYTRLYLVIFKSVQFSGNLKFAKFSPSIYGAARPRIVSLPLQRYDPRNRTLTAALIKCFILSFCVPKWRCALVII